MMRRRKDNRIDVRHFGARGDGKKLDTSAIQAALDHAGNSSGGTVHVPAGSYLCGTLRLRTHTTLHLESGAVLLGAEDPQLYPAADGTPALLCVDDAHDVAVIGQGAIDGQGKAMSREEARAAEIRPSLVVCRNSERIQFRDVTLRESCLWALHLKHCRDVTVRGLTIVSSSRRPNTDGIDPDGCRNVLISDCLIDTGDDCIVIKSTEGRPCEGVTVTNCSLRTSCAAIKVGTEAVGPIRNVLVSNCVIHDTQVGLALYMKDGSVYENMVFSNLVMDVHHAFPLILDVAPRDYKEPTIGRIRNVTLSDIYVTGPGRFYAEGQAGHPIENLTVRNLNWCVTGPVDRAATKPTGSVRVELDPKAKKHAANPQHFILVNLQRLTMDGVTLQQADAAVPRRELFFLDGVTESRVQNIYPRPVTEGEDEDESSEPMDGLSWT